MAFRVEITARAERDIAQTLQSLHQVSTLAAARWYSGLVKKLKTLSKSPDRVPIAAEAELLEIPLREVLYGKRPHVYRVLFVILEDVVQILHVRHAARDWVKPEEN